jgi:hypothetical protein
MVVAFAAVPGAGQKKPAGQLAHNAELLTLKVPAAQGVHENPREATDHQRFPTKRPYTIASLKMYHPLGMSSYPQSMISSERSAIVSVGGTAASCAALGSPLAHPFRFSLATRVLENVGSFATEPWGE